MSLLKRALSSLPAGDVASGGDASALTLVRQHDSGRSLMDRAQRQLYAQNEVLARAQA